MGGSTLHQQECDKVLFQLLGFLIIGGLSARLGARSWAVPISTRPEAAWKAFSARPVQPGCVFRSLPRNPPGASRSTSLGFSPPSPETPPDCDLARCDGPIGPAGHLGRRLTQLAAGLDLAMPGPHTFRVVPGKQHMEAGGLLVGCRDCAPHRSAPFQVGSASTPEAAHSRQPCPLPAEMVVPGGGFASPELGGAELDLPSRFSARSPSIFFQQNICCVQNRSS